MNLTRIHPTNTLFRRALDYHIYLLEDRWSHYSSPVLRQISKMAGKIDAQMKPQHFDASNPIKILSFLPEFQTACNANGIEEGAVM